MFSALEDINFAAKDPDTITEEVLSRYELYTGRSLARSDPVRLFLNAIILYFVQQRNAIDFAAKMNLLAYASGSYLDHIGALFGVTRLEATNATCTVRFTLSAALSFNVTIPAGTRITPDSKIFFAVNEDITIAAGQTQGEAVAVCETAGTSGNDYVAGQISKLVDPFPYEVEAVNIDASFGGEDAESDDAFRERIAIAPETFTTAGSRKAYEYYALSADSNIESVNIMTASDSSSITPGNVNIYVLMKDGALPSDDVLAKVLAACSGDDVRPDTDYVHALKPQIVNYSLNAEYWIDKADADRSWAIQSNVEAAVQNFIRWQRSELGRDINPSRLIHDITAAGAKRCNIISPGYSFVEGFQIAHLALPSSVVFKGLE